MRKTKAVDFPGGGGDEIIMNINVQLNDMI